MPEPELRRLARPGRPASRGRRYVLAQAALIGGVLLAPPGKGPVPGVLRQVGAALMLGGAGLGLAAGRRLGRNLTPLPQPVEGGTLVQSGLYAHVRHPIYSAVLLLCLGQALRRGSGSALGWTAALAALLRAKSEVEEAALVRRFPDYLAYRRRVGRFVPRRWPRVRPG